MIHYLVTIKNNAKAFVSLKDLKTQLRRLIAYSGGEWSDVQGCERDSLHRLHMHTIVCFSNTPSLQRISNLFRTGSWVCHFQRFPSSDYERVRKYCYKDACNLLEQLQEEEISILYYYHNIGDKAKQVA